MAATAEAVEPLPDVPVTWTTGYLHCGLSSALRIARMRVNLSSARCRRPAAERVAYRSRRIRPFSNSVPERNASNSESVEQARLRETPRRPSLPTARRALLAVHARWQPRAAQ